MNTQNCSSREGSVFDWSLVGKDSASLDIAFSNFLNDYKLICDEHLTYEEMLDKAKCRWSEMTQEQRMQFFPDDPNQSVSPKLVGGDRLVEGNAMATPTLSGTSTCGCYDTGFANYVETFTIQLTHQLAEDWEEMSHSEREAYAHKDNPSGASSGANDYERGHDPRISQMMIDMFGNECDNKDMKMKNQKAKPKCAKPKRRCKPKPKCSRPKPRCAKPKPRCAKPKPRCAKPKPRCAKPKPRCAKPKPKCHS